MPTISRIKAGHRAKSQGQLFENLILKSAFQEEINAIKIPDGCRTTRGPRGIQLMRVRTPFDYVLLKDGLAITLDCKSIDAASFSHSQLDQRQVHSLLECSKNAFKSGYLIWYRKPDIVAFHEVCYLQTLLRGKSLKPTENSIILGGHKYLELNKLFYRS